MSWFTKLIEWVKSLIGGSGGGGNGPKPWEGARKFFTCQFLLKNQWPMDNTMQFFAENVTDDQRQKYLDQVISLGLDSIFVFMLNADPTSWLTYYKDRNKIGGEVDPAKIELRKTWLSKMVSMGIQPICCMLCCEHNANQVWANSIITNGDKICSDIMPILEQYNPLWVSFLEAEKNVDGSGAQKVAEIMCKYTMSPIGIHSAKVEYITGQVGAKVVEFIKDYNNGERKKGEQLNCDDFLAWELYLKGYVKKVVVARGGYNWIAYERSENPNAWDNISPEQEYEDSKRVANNVRSPKRFMMFEYSLGRVNDKHERQGLAASFCDTTKTFGVGSGCTKDLGKFMRDLPVGMVSARAGSVIELKGSGITCVANLNENTFKRLTL